MPTNVANTTPYAWPYDGAFRPSRAALVLVGTNGGPEPRREVAALAGSLQAAGGVILQVRTTPSRRAESGPAPVPIPAVDVHVESPGIDGFFASPLDAALRARGRDQLLLAGAWLETGVHSTLRSANDRGYECLLVLDACTAYDPTLLDASRSQIEMSGGIFGAVGATSDVLAAIPVTERLLA